MIPVDVGRGGGGVGGGDGGVWERAREGRRKKSTCGLGGRPCVLQGYFGHFTPLYGLISF